MFLDYSLFWSNGRQASPLLILTGSVTNFLFPQKINIDGL